MISHLKNSLILPMCIHYVISLKHKVLRLRVSKALGTRRPTFFRCLTNLPLREKKIMHEPYARRRDCANAKMREMRPFEWGFDESCFLKRPETFFGDEIFVAQGDGHTIRLDNKRVHYTNGQGKITPHPAFFQFSSTYPRHVQLTVQIIKMAGVPIVLQFICKSTQRAC